MHRSEPRLAAAMLVLAAGVLAAPPAEAQPRTPPSFVQTQWTVRDGLPVNRLPESELLQSRDGYLWMSTRDGLVRFDGVRFTTFTMDNTEGLESNRILHLFETADGTLWLVTEEGLLIRYRHHRFSTVEGAGGGRPAAVNTLYAAPDGTLYAATDRGVARHEDGRLVPVRPDTLTAPASALLVDRRGTLWIGTETDGLLGVGPAGVTRYTTRDGLAEDAVLQLHHDGGGALWVQHASAVAPLSRCDQGRCTPVRLGSGGHQLHRDRHGRLWAAAGGRLFHHGDGRWQPVPADAGILTRVFEHDLDAVAQAGEVVSLDRAPPPTPPPAPALNRGLPVLRDREENVWMASPTDGLFRFTPALFHTVTGFEDPNLYAAAESRDGSLWFAAYSGRITQLRPDGELVRYGSPPAVGTGRMAVFEDRSGNLWVNQTLCRRAADGTCTAFEPVEALAHTQVLAVTEDRAGHLWFGTRDGLFRLVPGPDPAHPHHGAWTHFTGDDGLSHDHVRVVVESRRGGLWLGTNGGGLTRYRPEDGGAGTGRFIPLTTAHGLSSNSIRALYEDERGVLWVGTEDLGLARVALPADTAAAFDPAAARVFVYRESDGLYDNGLHAVVEDDDGRLWMSTNRGIFWVTRADLDAYAAGRLTRVPSTAYTVRDGLLDQEANGGTMHAALRARDGRLWFVTQAGAVAVDPATVRPNPVPPSVALEHATAQREPVPIRQGTLALPRGRRNFDITYTGISLGAPDLVRFRYRLEGYDPGWVEAGTRRTAFYTQVPPGRYTFRVLAANNDGVWNEQGAALTVHVPPFFYETWWFRVLALLSVLSLFVLLYEARLHSLRRRKQELARRVEERTRELREEKEKTEAQARRLLELDELKRHFFANISHEFRTPLTLIVGPLQQLLSGRHGALPAALREQHEMMLRNGRRLLRLINQILDLSRIESGAAQPQAAPQDLAAMADEAVRAFAPLAEQRRVALSRHTAPPPSPDAYVVAFDRDMMEKVLANLLSNALKFTPEGGRIEVALRAAPDAVTFTVTDDGCGIPADRLPHVFDRFYQVESGSRRPHQGTGIGLALVREFVALHGGRIDVESTVGRGTVFTVALPRTPAAAPARPPAPAPSAAAIEMRDAGPVDDLLSHGAAGDGAAGDGAVVEPALAAEDDEDRTTVLVVDDNADARAFVRSVLAPTYRVVEAYDGRHGLAVAREVLPDLIIADVMMPYLDGLDLNRALKQEPELACVPVILLTARATTEDQVAGLETEADAYVTKPFAPDALFARVGALLRIRHRLRDRLREEVPVPVVATGADLDPEALPARARRFVEDRLDDPGLTVSALAEAMALSASQLRRRLSDEADVTPSAFIRQVRLEAAAGLLDGRAGNVTEVAYAVGFQSLSHFTRSFRDHFGVTPSAYRDR